MSSNSIYYVYFYLRQDYTPYYIGKGKDKRAWSKGKDEIPKPKDTSKIIIVADNLSENYALILERYYIRWFGRKDNGTGILRNKTDGGDSCTYVRTEEHKLYMAERTKGKKVSEESKQKMSNSMKGRTPWNKGKVGVQVAWNKGKSRTKKIDELSIHHCP